MRAQQQTFSRAFRKSRRVRQLPRLVQMRDDKKRAALQSIRREKTVLVLEGGEEERERIEWSPEQLERIWKNTSG